MKNCLELILKEMKVIEPEIDNFQQSDEFREMMDKDLGGKTAKVIVELWNFYFQEEYGREIWEIAHDQARKQSAKTHTNMLESEDNDIGLR